MTSPKSAKSAMEDLDALLASLNATPAPAAPASPKPGNAFANLKGKFGATTTATNTSSSPSPSKSTVPTPPAIASKATPAPAPAAVTSSSAATGPVAAVNQFDLPRVGRSSSLKKPFPLTKLIPKDDNYKQSWERVQGDFAAVGLTVYVDYDSFDQFCGDGVKEYNYLDCYVFDRLIGGCAWGICNYLKDDNTQFPPAVKALAKDQMKTVKFVCTPFDTPNFLPFLEKSFPYYKIKKDIESNFNMAAEHVPSAKEIIIHCAVNKLSQLQNSNMSLEGLIKNLKGPPKAKVAGKQPAGSRLAYWEDRHLNPPGLSATEHASLVKIDNTVIVQAATVVPGTLVFYDWPSFHVSDNYGRDVFPIDDFNEQIKRGFDWPFNEGWKRQGYSRFLRLFIGESGNTTTGPLRAFVLGGTPRGGSDEKTGDAEEDKETVYDNYYFARYRAADQVVTLRTSTQYAVSYSPDTPVLLGCVLPFYPAPKGSSRPDALLGWDMSGMHPLYEAEQVFEKLNENAKGWEEKGSFTPFESLKQQGVVATIDWQSFIKGIPQVANVSKRNSRSGPFTNIALNVVCRGAAALDSTLKTLPATAKGKVKQWVVKAVDSFPSDATVPSYSKIYKMTFKGGVFTLLILASASNQMDSYIQKPITDFLADLIEADGPAVAAPMAKPTVSAPSPSPSTSSVPTKIGAPSSPSPIVSSSPVSSSPVSSSGSCHCVALRFNRLNKSGPTTALLLQFTKVAIQCGLALKKTIARQRTEDLCATSTYYFTSVGGIDGNNFQKQWTNAQKNSGFLEEKDDFEVEIATLTNAKSIRIVPSTGANALTAALNFYVSSSEDLPILTHLYSALIRNGFECHSEGILYFPSNSDFYAHMTWLFTHNGKGVDSAGMREVFDAICKEKGFDLDKGGFDYDLA